MMNFGGKPPIFDYFCQYLHNPPMLKESLPRILLREFLAQKPPMWVAHIRTLNMLSLYTGMCQNDPGNQKKSHQTKMCQHFFSRFSTTMRIRTPKKRLGMSFRDVQRNMFATFSLFSQQHSKTSCNIWIRKATRREIVSFTFFFWLVLKTISNSIVFSPLLASTLILIRHMILIQAGQCTQAEVAFFFS